MFANKVELIPRICNANFGEVCHDPLHNNEEVDLVGGFLQGITDDSDIWHDIEIIGQTRAEIHFSERIQELDAHGFWVFGMAKRKEIRFASDQPGLKPDAWDIGYVFVVMWANILSL